MRVGAVLDQREVVASAEFEERVEVGGGTGDVHGDDRPGPRRDRRLGRGDVDAQRVGVDVDEDRRGVDRKGGARRRHERHAGDDHLVALADIAGRQRRFEGVRAVREREAVRRAVVGGEVVRERRGDVAVPRPPPAGVEHRQQVLAFVAVPDRPRRIVRSADGAPPRTAGVSMMELMVLPLRFVSPLRPT